MKFTKDILRDTLPDDLYLFLGKAINGAFGSKANRDRLLKKLATDVLREKENDKQVMKIVFFSRGSEFMIIFETLLALALKHCGVKSIFVVCDGLDICNFSSIKRPEMNCKSCFSRARIPEKLGFDVYPLSHFLQTYTKDNDMPDDIDKCQAFSMKGVEIGNYLKSSLLRFFLVNDLNEIDDNVLLLSVYKRFLSASIQTHGAVANIVHSLEPDRIMILNSLYGQMRTAYEFFKLSKLKCISYEAIGTPKGNYWIFSDDEPVLSLKFRGEWNHWKTLQSPRPFWDYYKKRRKSELQKNRYFDSPFNLSDAVLLLTNVQWDISNIALDSPFSSLMDWISETIAHFIESGENLIVRIHPSDTNVYESDDVKTVRDVINEIFESIPSNIWIIDPEDKIDSYSLIDACRRVAVWSSTIGMEMAYDGREPVVTANVHYSRKGFTGDINTKKEYFDALKETHDRLSDDRLEMANRYCSYFLLRKKIPLKLFETKGPFSFDITKFSPHYSDFHPDKDETLKFVCESIVNGTPFVLTDGLIADSWGKHTFPMKNR